MLVITIEAKSVYKVSELELLSSGIRAEITLVEKKLR